MGNKICQIEDSIIIEKDIKTVWDNLVVFSNHRLWNPVVNHAVIYGPLAAGTSVKIISGKWEFDFVIKDVSFLKKLEMTGRSTGLNLDIICEIEGNGDISKIKIAVRCGGLIPRIFKNKSRDNIEESLRALLTALKKRTLSDGIYCVSRNDEKADDSRERRISMPTPFNILYKTGSRKPRKRRFRFK